MKKIFSLFVMLMLISIIASNLAAQPQYYNYNSPGTANGFPFTIPSGKMIQTLYLPGEFSNPTPAPGGKQITSVFVQLHSAMTDRSFTDLTIKMGQTTLTDLTAGSFYSGPMTTVYSRSAITISNPADWLEFILDTPFPYDPTKSIVIEIGQCSTITNAGGNIRYTITSGIKRIVSYGGCPYVVYTGGSSYAYITHCGINLTTVGIEEKKPLKVEIYPVPNDGQFNISLGGTSASELSMEVYNSLGLMIFSKMISGQQNSQVIPVDLKPVPPGIYTIILRSSGEQTLHKKIVVTK